MSAFRLNLVKPLFLCRSLQDSTHDPLHPHKYHLQLGSLITSQNLKPSSSEAPSFPSWVHWGKTCPSPSLSFLICKVGIGPLPLGSL